MTKPVEPKARKHSLKDRVEGILPVDRSDGGGVLNVDDLEAFLKDAKKEGVSEIYLNFDQLGRYPVGLVFFKEAARQ
ncbi:hypothetical protein [Lentzea sp. NBRC 102530]|uniref:hypothetical protein n=1 Tax=Lentzea sp. NBRC 102530 TaxID=3032201 RepID=UPI0024A59F3F|nr:hypothetical protein [Lentzea sp. NBRC 102530]GLY55367.1 hypothetical protein Lesp01_90220 [Lentzea sp. NBRC 102530]